MKKFLLISSVFLLVLGISGFASANLIDNGNFEALGGSFDQWTTSGDMRIGEAGLIDGIQGMDDNYALFGLNLGNDISNLNQSFDISGISTIQVSFNWAFDFVDFNKWGDDTFLSIIGGQTANSAKRITMQDLKTGSIIGLNHGFYDQIIDISDFTSNSAVLGFQLKEGAGFVFSAAGIDNVSIKAVPEPGTMLLLGFGLLGLAGAGRKKIFKK